jgi:transcriptional regulator with XRE-family HTH domain
MIEQSIMQDEVIHIGRNIRRIRKEQGYNQNEFVRMLNLEGVKITREAFVKIERGVQNIKASQLECIRNLLHTTYDELLKR